MSKLARWEQAAIEQIAEQFSATWTQGKSGSPCLILAGQRIAVRVAAIAPAACGDLNAPRLRFDKVALRVVGRLQAALAADVADAQAVLFTITAPIRLPSKTVAELERVIRQRLAEATTRAEIDDTICANAHANMVRIRFVGGAGRSAKVIGFVHNPESDPAQLLNLAQALIQCIGAATNPPVSKSFSGERWLAIVDEQGPGSIETYRQVYSQLGDWVAGDFRKILLLCNGRVETLSA